MIISKTPLRISFFGGGTDFPEFFNFNKSKIIGTAIDKSIFISKNFFPPQKDFQLKLFYSKVEQVKKVNQIKHKVIKNLIKELKITENLELHFISDLPSFSGLGSSSSFTTGLSNLFFYILKKKYSKKGLADFVINFERNSLKEKVGFQDQIFASYGGFNCIDFSKNNYRVKNYVIDEDLKKIEDCSFLIHTNIKRKAENIEKKKIKKIKKNQEKLNFISDIANEAEKYLNKKKLTTCFETLLNESWNLKKKLDSNVSNFLIDRIYEKCLGDGATAGKLLGAGAGGFLYMYVPKRNQINFIKKNKSAIKIKFTNEGSKIIKV